MRSPLNTLLIGDKLAMPQRHSEMASCRAPLHSQGSTPTQTHGAGPANKFMNCLLGATTLGTVLGTRAIMTTQNSSCGELYNQELLGTNEIKV